MNILKKLLTTGLFVFALCSTPVWAMHDEEYPDDPVLTTYENNNPQSDIACDITDFISVPACYVGGYNLYVVIDSIDNTVDMIFRNEAGFDTTIKIPVDVAKGRHDLVNILRPKSVGFFDNHVVFLASSKKDSSYLAFVDLDGNIVKRVDFSCCSYAFHVFPDELIVMGRNPLGYDINILDISQGIDGVKSLAKHHYHRPKQADEILKSDPVGIGLTVVAVSVVFLALLCISLILKGYGKLIMRTQDRKANKVTQAAAASAATPSASETSGEIYAAIATAIYLYDEELHDEEDTIITIQKVERAWTPWNAKYYNMNHYFNNRK